MCINDTTQLVLLSNTHLIEVTCVSDDICVGKARKTASSLCGQAHMHQINWSSRDRSMCRRWCSLQSFSHWASRPYQCQTKRFPCHTFAAFSVNCRHSWSNLLSSQPYISSTAQVLGLASKLVIKPIFVEKPKATQHFYLIGNWIISFRFARSPFVRYSPSIFSSQLAAQPLHSAHSSTVAHSTLTRGPFVFVICRCVSITCARSHALHMPWVTQWTVTALC